MSERFRRPDTPDPAPTPERGPLFEVVVSWRFENSVVIDRRGTQNRAEIPRLRDELETAHGHHREFSIDAIDEIGPDGRRRSLIRREPTDDAVAKERLAQARAAMRQKGTA